MGPDADPEGEGGGHLPAFIIIRRGLLDAVMDLHGGVGDGVGESGVLGGIAAVVDPDTLADVLGDPLDGEAAGLLAPGAAADAIGDHGHEGEALGRGPPGALGKAGEVDLHLPPERRDEEVVLVGFPHAADVGEAEDVEFFVGRAARGVGGGWDRGSRHT